MSVMPPVIFSTPTGDVACGKPTAMLKVSIQFDGGHFSKGAFAFAKQLSEIVPISLTGSFLRQSDFVNLWNPGPLVGIPELPFGDEQSMEEESMEKFRSA